MATPGDLSRVVAKTFNMPEVTVANCYRALREANMVPKAGRGPVSSVAVTSGTAAKLLIALCGSQHEKEAPPKILEKFDSLVAHWAEFKDEDMVEAAECEPNYRLAGYHLPCFGALPSRHKFIDGLATIIETSARGEFPFEQRGKLRIPNRVTISIEIGAAPDILAIVNIMIQGRNGYIKSTVEYRPAEHDARDRDEYLAFITNADLSIRREFRTPTIIELGDLLKIERPTKKSSNSADGIVGNIDTLVATAEAKAELLKEAGSPEEKAKFGQELLTIMETLERLKANLSNDED